MMLLNCGVEKTLESPLACKEIQPVVLKAGGEGMTEDDMVGLHHRLNGLEFG